MSSGYYVLWSDLDYQYVGRCHAFPSLSYLADTQIDALIGIEALAKEAVEEIQRDRKILLKDYSQHPSYKNE